MNFHPEVKNFRRFLAYCSTILAWATVEVVVDGGVSTNGYMSLIAVAAAYFGTVAWDKVTASKNGNGNGQPSN